MGARYIFGNKNLSNITHMVTSFASGIISNPYQLENTLGMVRTFAPLTSVQTVGKINTFLPLIEKFSSSLGMYSFISKAQNYAPVQSLGNKPPIEKVTSLITNGNIPLTKILAQPIIAKNMDKIVNSVASSFINNSMKNGSLDQMISGLMGQMSNNTGSSEQTEGNANNSFDLNAILEALGPILNNKSS